MLLLRICWLKMAAEFQGIAALITVKETEVKLQMRDKSNPSAYHAPYSNTLILHNGIHFVFEQR